MPINDERELNKIVEDYAEKIIINFRAFREYFIKGKKDGKNKK